MYISTLSADEWEGVYNPGREIVHPSLNQIEQAILALDNDNKTLVMLAADEDHWLGVAGGGEIGVYLVTVTEVDTFYLAVTPDALAGDVWIVAGGQGSDRPLRECVGLDAALRAAHTYALDGSLDSSLTWELA